jgi:hypothetical protein
MCPISKKWKTTKKTDNDNNTGSCLLYRRKAQMEPDFNLMKPTPAKQSDRFNNKFKHTKQTDNVGDKVLTCQCLRIVD